MHLFIYLLTYLFIYLLTYLFIYIFIYLLIYFLIYLFICKHYCLLKRDTVQFQRQVPTCVFHLVSTVESSTLKMVAAVSSKMFRTYQITRRHSHRRDNLNLFIIYVPVPTVPLAIRNGKRSVNSELYRGGMKRYWPNLFVRMAWRNPQEPPPVEPIFRVFPPATNWESCRINHKALHEQAEGKRRIYQR